MDGATVCCKICSMWTLQNVDEDLVQFCLSLLLVRDVQNQTKLWEYSLSCLKEHLTDDVLKEVGETLENIRSLEREDGSTGGEVTKEETRKPENEGETKEETDGVKDGGGDSDTKETQKQRRR